MKKKILQCKDEDCASFRRKVSMGNDPHNLSDKDVNVNTMSYLRTRITDPLVNYFSPDTIPQEDKFFDKIWIHTNYWMTNRYIYGLFDTGGEINMVSEDLLNALHQLPNCQNPTVIKGIVGSTRLCKTNLYAVYRNIKGLFEFIVQDDLQDIIGSPVLIGKPLIYEVIKKNGKLEIVPAEKSMKYERKAQNTRIIPKTFKLNASGLIADFKRTGNINYVAREYGLTIDRTINAIKRLIKKDEEELVNWLLRKKAKVDPRGYMKEVSRNYSVISSKIEYLRKRIKDIQKAVFYKGQTFDKKKLLVKLHKELKAHKKMSESMARTIANKQFDSYRSIIRKKYELKSIIKTIIFDRTINSLEALMKIIGGKKAKKGTILYDLRNCKYKFVASSKFIPGLNKIRLIINKTSSDWVFIAEILFRIKSEKNIEVRIEVKSSKSYSEETKEALVTILKIIKRQFY